MPFFRAWIAKPDDVVKVVLVVDHSDNSIADNAGSDAFTLLPFFFASWMPWASRPSCTAGLGVRSAAHARCARECWRGQYAFKDSMTHRKEYAKSKNMLAFASSTKAKQFTSIAFLKSCKC